MVPPRRPGSVQPGCRHDPPGPRRAGPGQPGQFGGGPAGDPSQPVHQGSGRRQTALHQPATQGPPGQHQSPRPPPGPVVHRPRHIGRGPPADHGALPTGSGTHHLAGPVAGADDHRRPLDQPEGAGGGGPQVTADPVRRDDRGQLGRGRSGQSVHHPAVEVVEARARGHGGIGDHPTAQPPRHQVPGGQNPSGGVEVRTPVSGQPGQFGRHRAGLDGDTGPVEHLLPTSHGPGQCRGLGGRPAVRPHKGGSERRAVGAHHHQGLARPGAPHHLHGAEVVSGPGAEPRTSVHQGRPPARRVLLGPVRPGTGGHQGDPAVGHHPVRSPQGHLGDGGAHVDRQDHRRGVLLEDGPAHGQPGTAAGHDVAGLLDHPDPSTPVAGSAQKQHRHPHRGHHPGHGVHTGGAGGDIGYRDLQQRCPEVVGDHRGQDDVPGVPGHPAPAPQDRLDERLEPGRPGVLQHPAQEFQGRRPSPVVRIDAGHQLDPAPPVLGRPADRGHQAVIEFERRAGQPGPVEGEVGADVRAQGPRPGQRPQRFGGGQNPVAVGQGLLQGPEIVGVALDGHDPAGPVVGRQDQSRYRQRPDVGRTHARPDRAKTTLATEEKSSRPYPASEAAASAARATVVVVRGTPAPSA